MRIAALLCLQLLVAATSSATVAPTPSPTAASSAKTYVLVHGAWGGGWAWRGVAALLTKAGHQVHRVTLTGLGERAHLARADIDLDTHIQDVVNTLLYEELEDVILVGHSYGGMVITGVADRAPGRIRHLVYIDAFLPENGESVTGIRRATPQPAPDALLGPVKDGFLVPPWLAGDHPVPYDVPHPQQTFHQSIDLKDAAARRLPGTYILTVDPGATVDPEFGPFALRAKKRGFTVHQMAADHNPQRTAPEELVKLLLGTR